MSIVKVQSVPFAPETKLADVLQEYVGNVLKLFDEFNTKMDQGSVHIAAIQKIISEFQGAVSKEQEATIKSLISSLRKLMAEAREISSTKIPYALKPFYWRINMIKTFSDVSSDEIKNIQESIQLAVKKAELQVDDVDQKLQSILDDLDKQTNMLTK